MYLHRIATIKGTLLRMKMQDKKTVHIVFQVLNFLSRPHLSADYNLSSDEKLLLIFLAKYKGGGGIYPSVSTLGRHLQRNVTSIRRSLRRLLQKKLIKIQYVPGKSSNYTLFIPCDDLSTTTGVDALGICDAPRASTPVHPVRTRPTTPRTDARLSERDNNHLNKTERTRTKRASALSDDFEPNKQSCQTAKEAGLTQDEANYEFEKFMNHYLENEEKKKDWQLVLKNWFIRAGEYKRTHGAITVKPEEVRSTVPWHKPSNAYRGDPQAIGRLLNGLPTKARDHMNGSGGKNNGLGLGSNISGKREETKT